jgi:hypothetical protein
MPQEGLPGGETGLSAEEAHLPASNNASRRVRNSRRNNAPSTRTGSRKAGRDEIQRVPSGAIPPPGTIMCTCG